MVSTGPAEPDSFIYPDVAESGDLRTALQRVFDASGIELRAQPVSSPGWIRVGAEARVGDRHATVLMARDERAFLTEFWLHGVYVAKGRTDNLHDTAAAIAAFVGGATLRQLAAGWPFVRHGGFAEALEIGEPEAIAYRWKQYLTVSPATPRFMRNLHDYLAAAAGEPRLRALFPFTSHLDLGLRRSVRHNHSRALVWVRPFRDGRYLIAGPDRRQLYTDDPVRRTIYDTEPVPGALGPADAPESVTLTLITLDRQPQAQPAEHNPPDPTRR